MTTWTYIGLEVIVSIVALMVYEMICTAKNKRKYSPTNEYGILEAEEKESTLALNCIRELQTQKSQLAPEEYKRQLDVAKAHATDKFLDWYNHAVSFLHLSMSTEEMCEHLMEIDRME